AGRYEPATHGFAVTAAAAGFAFGPVPSGVTGPDSLPLRGALEGRLDASLDAGAFKGGGRFDLRDLTVDGGSLGAAAIELKADPGRPAGFTAEVRVDGADLAAIARAASQAGKAEGTASLAARYSGAADRPAAGTWEIDLSQLEGKVMRLPVRSV